MGTLAHPSRCTLLGDAKKTQRGAALVSSRAWKEHSAPEAECFMRGRPVPSVDCRPMCRVARGRRHKPATAPMQAMPKGLPNCSHPHAGS